MNLKQIEYEKYNDNALEYLEYIAGADNLGLLLGEIPAEVAAIGLTETILLSYHMKLSYRMAAIVIWSAILTAHLTMFQSSSQSSSNHVRMH